MAKRAKKSIKITPNLEAELMSIEEELLGPLLELGFDWNISSYIGAYIKKVFSSKSAEELIQDWKNCQFSDNEDYPEIKLGDDYYDEETLDSANEIISKFPNLTEIEPSYLAQSYALEINKSIVDKELKQALKEVRAPKKKSTRAKKATAELVFEEQPAVKNTQSTSSQIIPKVNAQRQESESEKKAASA